MIAVRRIAVVLISVLILSVGACGPRDSGVSHTGVGVQR